MTDRIKTLWAEEIPVEVTWKSIRSVRLRIAPDGTAKLSVPSRFSEKKAAAFLRAHADWLRTAMRHSQARREAIPVRGVFPGAQRMILGKTVTLRILSAPKKETRREGDTILLYTPSEDPAQWEAQYDAWLKKEALSLFTEMAMRYFPRLSLRGRAFPALSVRKMTSRWGSCTPGKDTIRFNLYLYEAEPACIEAVVVHEMAHLLHPDHSADFYRCVRGILPDYDARHSRLSQTVLPGGKK